MTVREALQSIYDEYGRLTPNLVVEVARQPGHPLHARVFDVPPEQAAERYYLDRAHDLIQSVKVRFRDPDTSKPVDVRAFHAVRSPAGHVYEPLEKVAEDPLLRALVLRDMEREWRALRARYEAFQEFLAMVRRDIDAAG